MKKKIFLITLMVALFVCLFAISASAAAMFESDYTSEVTKFYDGETELTPSWCNLTDKEATAVIKKADGTAIRIPLYYIYQVNGTSFYGDIRDTSNTTYAGFKYAWISEKLGETVNHANLVALEIPNGMTGVQNQFGTESTIYSALEELVIPSSVTSLPSKMFRDNIVMKKVFVKQVRNEDDTVQGVTKIPDYFADRKDSKNPSALEFFGMELDYCTSVGTNAFNQTYIKEIRIEAPITALNGFSSCPALETIYINNTGATITMAQKAFAYDTALKSVTLNGISLSNYAFEINVGTGTQGGLVFKATNVAFMGDLPFKNLSNLESVDISGPITEIKGSTFNGCTNLKNVKIINNLAQPAICGNNMCDGLKNLQSVELHGISIGSYAFRNVNGTDMTVKCTNVGSIGTEAFKAAGNITELYISGPFASIGDSTYRECPKLKKLTVINTGDTLVSAGNGESNSLLEELHLDGKFYIKYPAFQNNIKLKNIYLGTGMETIGAQAFYKCYALETAYLADTITAIADSAFDMSGSGKQTSTSFMFVDENGNMDNTLPTSLTSTGGHFLKGFTFANTQLIYPKGYTSAENSAYDFEGAICPDGFNIVYLGKMTIVNQHILYQHKLSKDVTIYLAGNSASDLSGERINVNIAQDGSMSHGTYAGSTTGTLQIVIDDNLHNNINAISYVKFIFCGSNEVVFVTRVNIPREEGGSASWGNFVSMPVTYEQLETAYNTYNTANSDAQEKVPSKHPILTAPEFYEADCTNDGGNKVFCVGCGALVSFEKTADKLGHDYDIMNATAIVYADYTKDGTYTTVCLRCTENVSEVVEGSYLFEYHGISTNRIGTGVCAGYELNRTYINAYQNLKGDAFEFGVLATIVMGDNFAPLSAGYESNVAKAPLSGAEFSGINYVDIVVKGNYTDVVPENLESYNKHLLALSLYVNDDGVVKYVWDTETDDTGTHDIVTTTDIYTKKVA